MPGERQLAERFDVSRATIREVEIALEAMLSAAEHTALEEVKRRIGAGRQRFLVTTQI